MAEKVTYTLQGLMNIADIQQKIKTLKNNLNNLNIKDSHLKNDFRNIFDELEKEIKNYQELLQNGFKTKADVSGLNKSGKQIMTLINRIVGTFESLEDVNLSNIFNIDSSTKKNIEQLNQKFREVNKEIKDINTSNLQKLQDNLNQLTTEKAKLGGEEIKSLVNVGNIEEAIRATEQYLQAQEQAKKRLTAQGRNTANVIQNINALNKIKEILSNLDTTDLNNLRQELDGISQEIKQLENASLSKTNNQFRQGAEDAQKLADATEEVIKANNDASESQREFNNEIDNIKGKITYFFGLENAINLLRTAVRNAFESVKELDAAMTETAVVTDFTVGDMWEALPQYTQTANELGATTLGAYETMTLFYQQGLNTNQAFEVGTETMKMARIAAMDYTEATNLMTAALRGFNMELNETSAKRINDVYSELAAITAADTHEIGVAMSKTASIANNANMEFETTAALLSQIIETTREAPETAGTAMKTIIARFSEVKELFSQGQLTGTDSEGEEININKIDTALQQVGISLKDFLIGNQGLDDVFLQLAERWDTLDLATQRYIATVAAGSRQQSRFLAMMSNYDRTMELVDAAYNSTGASSAQFEKTMDSLEAKLNELKNAWNEFTMGLANNELIKLGVDILTQFLTVLNELTSILGEGTSGILKFIAAIGLFKGGKKLFNRLLGSFSNFWAEATGKAGNAGEKVAENFYIRFSDNLKNKKINFTDLFNATMSSKDAESLVGSWITSFDPTKNMGQNLADFTLQDNTLNLSKNTQEVLKNISANTTLTNIEKTKATTMALTNSRLTLYIKSLFGFTNASRTASTAALGLNTATSTLGATMKALPLGWIGIGIAGVIGAIKLLDVAIETSNERLERLNETAERSAQASQDATQALTELGNSIQTIRDSDSLFEGLTYGTIEWKNALIEANQQVLDLINKYPELAQYVETVENGRLTIPDEPLEDFYNKQLENQQNLAFASQLDQANIAAENIRQLEADLAVARGKLSELQRRQESEAIPRSSSDIETTAEDYQDDINVQNTKILELTNDLNAKQVELTSALTTAYSGLVSDIENLNTEGKEALSQVLSDFYDTEEYNDLIKDKKVEIQNELNASGDTIRDLYFETFGVEADEEWSDAHIKMLLAETRAAEEISGTANDIIDTIKDSDLNENLSNVVLRGVQEDSQIRISDLETLMTPVEEGGLGYSLEDLQNLNLDNLGVNISELATELDTTTDKLREQFNTNIANATWAFELVSDSANLTKEELDNLALQLQTQKGIIDAGGQIDLTNLSYQQLMALDTSQFTSEMQAAFEVALQHIRASNLQDSYNFNKIQTDYSDLIAAMSAANISETELNILSKEFKKQNNILKENDELLNQILTDYLELDVALNNLKDVLGENAEALENIGSSEYLAALPQVTDAVANLLGIDANLIDSEFIDTNLEDIQAAANGSAEALERLLMLGGKQLVFDLDIDQEQIDWLWSELEGLNGYEIETGATLDNQDFINKLNEMIAAGQISVTKLNKIFDTIGWEPEFGEKTVPFNPFKNFKAPKINTDNGVIASILGGLTSTFSSLASFGGELSVPYIKSATAKGDTSLQKAASSAGARGSSGKSSGSSGSTKQEDPWENTFDRLYNLLEDINEEERIRNELELEFDRITEDGVYNSNQVLENLREQEASLIRQQKLQQMLYNEREKEMRNLLVGNKDLQKYGTYNWNDETIEINWDLINSVTNQEQGERIEEYISELERIQESMDEADDALEDIKDQIEELKDFGKDEYEDFEQLTLDAIIRREQDLIDSLSEINNSVNNSNQKLLDGLTRTIDNIRQARENAETEQEINDTQQYLAYLQRDTSNANLLEILQTRDELEQQQQDYTDSLIDQKINELEMQNEVAAQQREKQIELMQAQLDRDEEFGLLWNEVYTLWQSGIDNNGVILPNSELEQLLQNAADYQSFSKFGQTEWATELARQVEAADTWRKNTSSRGLNGVEAKLTTINTSIGKIKVGTSTAANSKVTSSKSSSSGSSSSRGSSSSSSSSYSSSSSSGDKSVANIKKLQRALNVYVGSRLTIDGIYGSATKQAVVALQALLHIKPGDGLYGQSTYNAFKRYVQKNAGSGASYAWQQYGANAVYKKGGLADFTGPAWLDGTKSKPELVLNAQDTQNFIALKNVLSDLMSSNFSGNIPKGGDNYYEVNIQVDELSNDYDVDQLAARVKKILSDDGRYRNVNSINLLR